MEINRVCLAHRLKQCNFTYAISANFHASDDDEQCLCRYRERREALIECPSAVVPAKQILGVTVGLVPLSQPVPHEDSPNVADVELTALRQEVEELRQAIRARDDFIAIAAHELRNPMTPIIGTAELALKAVLSSEVPFPPRVITLLERMLVMTEDFIRRSTRLLDVSRLRSGNLKLEWASTDLSCLVRSVADRYQASAIKSGGALIVEIEEDIIAVIDALATEQVVENLLTNALKFGTGSPVTVRLCSDETAARLEVQDRGIGMSLEQQKRLFGRFEQVMSQHRGSGFGVGLWLSSRLVKAMNGQMTVESQVGEGSVFTVELPLHPPIQALPNDIT